MRCLTYFDLKNEEFYSIINVIFLADENNQRVYRSFVSLIYFSNNIND